MGLLAEGVRVALDTSSVDFCPILRRLADIMPSAAECYTGRSASNERTPAPMLQNHVDIHTVKARLTHARSWQLGEERKNAAQHVESYKRKDKHDVCQQRWFPTLHPTTSEGRTSRAGGSTRSLGESKMRVAWAFYRVIGASHTSGARDNQRDTRTRPSAHVY